jgi:elongation factor P
MHEGTDTTPKEATLENGQKVLVPQFIKEGDVIKVDVESGKYIDRIKK